MNENTNRSKFVTALAWVFIATAGFTTFMSLLQTFVLLALFPMDDMNETLRQAGGAEIPLVFRFLFAHVQLVFFVSILLSATTLVSSVGLLKRQNWARIFFVWMLGLGIFWTLISIPAIFLIPSGIPPELDDAFGDRFQTMLNLVKGFSFLLALAHCALFGWIIKKLISPKIKSEFGLAG